jgi:TP901 family phage tail tape measure protein
MAQARPITVKVTLDDDGFLRDISNVEEKMGRVWKSGETYVDAQGRLHDAATGRFLKGNQGMEFSLGSVAKAAGIAAVAIGTTLVGGLALAATKAVKLAGDLEQGVAKISSIKPEIDTRQVFQALNEMSTRIPQSAESLGDALYDIFSSINVAPQQGLVLLEKFAKGATAAVTDTKTFGTAVIGVMNAYGLAVEDTDHIMDVFFNTVKNGVVSGEELARGLGPVTQSAKSAGVELNELGALLVGITKEGGEASQNINNLNNFLQKVTTESAVKGLKGLGIEVKNSHGEFRPMIDILSDMQTKLDGVSEFEKAQIFQKLFPDAQARQGAQTLLSQLEAVREALKENEFYVGASKEAYEKMVATWNSQTTLLQNSALAILRQIGAEILPYITPLVKAIAEEVPKGIQLVKTAIAGLKQIWDSNWGGIRETTLRVVGEIKKFANEGLDGVVKWWKDNLPLIKQTVQTVLNGMATFWREHGREITEIVRNAWEVLKSVVSAGARILGDTIKIVMQVINGDWAGVWHSLWDIVKAVFSGILGTIKGATNGINAAFKLLVEYGFEALWGMAGDAKKAAEFLIAGLVEGIKGGVNLVTSAIKWLADKSMGALNGAWQIQSPSKVGKQAGAYLGEGIAEGITSKAADVAKASKELAQSAIKEARDAITQGVVAMNASLDTLRFQRAAAEARDFNRVLGDIHETQRELNISLDESVQVNRELNNIQRIKGETEDAFQRRRVEGARAILEGLKGIKLGLENEKRAVAELETAWDRLQSEQSGLASDKEKWAKQQTERWLEQKQQTEEVLVLVNREKEVRLAALKEIDEADRNARDSIVASRVYIADQTVFHSDRATASILGHLAKQKGVTESVADAFIGLYDNVFGKLNSLIDGWTSKLGIFGEFVGTIFKGIVNNIANNILGSLFGQNGLLSGIVNRIGGTLGNVLGSILGTGGGASGGAGGILSGILGGGGGGASGGIGGIISGILGGGGASGGATSGVLGGILGALGIGGTASIAGGTTALAGGAVGLSTIGAGAAGLSGISTTTALGTAAGAGTTGIGGILASIGSFATSGLGIATFGIGTAAALIGTWLVKRAKQRRNDEEASGVALQDAVDLIKNTATEIDSDKLRFGTDADSQALLNDGILKPFKDFINTLKTASVRDSRLTNQVRDLENLYNDLVGSAIKRQQERLAAAANPTTNTGTTSGTGGSDPFNFASTPTTVTIETLTVSFLAGTEDASKVVVAGAQTKDGQAVIVKTVKIAAANGEL